MIATYCESDALANPKEHFYSNKAGTPARRGGGTAAVLTDDGASPNTASTAMRRASNSTAFTPASSA